VKYIPTSHETQTENQRFFFGNGSDQLTHIFGQIFIFAFPDPGHCSGRKTYKVQGKVILCSVKPLKTLQAGRRDGGYQLCRLACPCYSSEQGSFISCVLCNSEMRAVTSGPMCWSVSCLGLPTHLGEVLTASSEFDYRQGCPEMNKLEIRREVSFICK
jgi:hypothetical protein